eukprot:9154919-Pyramimonas_sp.AAC.1
MKKQFCRFPGPLRLLLALARRPQASLAQELYSALFGWLTRLVARGIAPPSLSGNGQGASEPGGCQLGLLDLYGFEVFRG